MRLVAGSWLPLRRAWLRRRVGRLVLEQVQDIQLVVLPDVFNPAVFRTSNLLVEAVKAHVRPGASVLDVGTGSGVAAIAAALAGAQVRAVDSNPEAVRCARLNAILNAVESHIEVAQGDLFDTVRDARFDAVLCNPPFFRGVARHRRDAAWRSPDFIERFAAGLDSVLAADGLALIVYSDHADAHRLAAAFASTRFAIETDRTRHHDNEVITVYRMTRAPVGG
jgi:release factor glutamine methyltransferase